MTEPILEIRNVSKRFVKRLDVAGKIADRLLSNCCRGVVDHCGRVAVCRRRPYRKQRDLQGIWRVRLHCTEAGVDARADDAAEKDVSGQAGSAFAVN